MHKRSLCRRAVSVYPSIRPSHLCILSKRVNIFKLFLPSVSHTILVFHTNRYGNIPTGTPRTRTSNAGGVGKNCSSQPISGFVTCCQRSDRQVLFTQLPYHGKLATLVTGKWHHLLFAGDDDKVL